MVPSRGDATREDFLTAAATLFARDGYRAARLDEIVAATGRTKGALYFHFSGKADLATAVIREHKGAWLAAVREAVDTSAPPAEQLRQIGETLVELSSADDTGWAVLKLIRQLADAGVDSDTAQEDPLQEWVELIAPVISAGQADGSLRDSDSATDLALVLVASFNGLKAAHAGDSPNTDFRRQGRALIHTLLDGIRR